MRELSLKTVLSRQCGPFCGLAWKLHLEVNLHSPERHLIELRMEHADLDALVDRLGHESPIDELMVRRLKKRRLALRDQIARLELALQPKEPA